MAKDVHSGVKEYANLLEKGGNLEKENFNLKKVVLSGGALKRQNANLLVEVSEMKQQNTQLLRQLGLEGAKRELLAKEEQINQAVRLQLSELSESLSKLLRVAKNPALETIIQIQGGESCEAQISM